MHEQQEVPSIVIFGDDTWLPAREVPEQIAAANAVGDGRPGQTHEEAAAEYYAHFMPGIEPRRHTVLMTLDDAIEHARSVAATRCDSCGVEHLQLAAWLQELKRYRDGD